MYLGNHIQEVGAKMAHRGISHTVLHSHFFFLRFIMLCVLCGYTCYGLCVCRAPLMSLLVT